MKLRRTPAQRSPSCRTTPAEEIRPKSAPSAPPEMTHILLIEDHAESASALAFLLRHYGYRVQVAATQDAALALARDHTFDLVISDLGLPDGDGRAVMMRLHQQYRLVGIAMTGMSLAEEPPLDRYGFVETIAKPIEFTELFSAIAQAKRLR